MENIEQVLAAFNFRNDLQPPQSAIDRFFAQPIPESLWHYTSVEGLEGILSTQKVFATEARHTTDPDEFSNACQVATDYVDKMRSTDEASLRTKEAAASLLDLAFGKDGLFGPNKHEIVVASFTAAYDNRSQWDSYALHASGVSIAFDLRGVRPPVEMQSGVTLAPCVYVEREKEALLQEALRIWTTTREALFQQSNSQPLTAKWLANDRLWDQYLGLVSSPTELMRRKREEFSGLIHRGVYRAAFQLLRIASHCKKGSFLDENEWRLALPRRVGKDMEHSTVLRRGPKGEVPYVASNLFHFRLPITQVMLGGRCMD